MLSLGSCKAAVSVKAARSSVNANRRRISSLCIIRERRCSTNSTTRARAALSCGSRSQFRAGVLFREDRRVVQRHGRAVSRLTVVMAAADPATWVMVCGDDVIELELGEKYTGERAWKAGHHLSNHRRNEVS